MAAAPDISSDRSALPNPDAVFRLDEHLVTLLYPERRVPRVDVPFGDRTAGRGRCVRVRENQIAKRVIPVNGAPDLRVCHEEPLIAGDALQTWGRLSFQ